MSAHGLKEVISTASIAGEKDYRRWSPSSRTKADVVYFGGYHPEAGLILRQAAEQNLKFQLIMRDSIASPESGSSLARHGEGTIVEPKDPHELIRPAVAARCAC